MGRVIDPVFSRDKFFFWQKTFALGQKYLVLDEAKNKLLYIEATAFVQLKLAFVAYRDESKQHKLFSFRQEKLFGGNYAIADEDDSPIGEIKWNLGWLMYLKGWQICDASGRELARIRYARPFTRRRRKVGWNELLLFEFVTPSGQLIGDLVSSGFFRRWETLNLTGDSSGSLDRRLAISACIVGLNATGRGGAC